MKIELGVLILALGNNVNALNICKEKNSDKLLMTKIEKFS